MQNWLAQELFVKLVKEKTEALTFLRWCTSYKGVLVVYLRVLLKVGGIYLYGVIENIYELL